MLKFCLTERTYRNPTITQNFVRIAQGACRYCIAFGMWCILHSSSYCDWSSLYFFTSNNLRHPSLSTHPPKFDNVWQQILQKVIDWYVVLLRHLSNFFDQIRHGRGLGSSMGWVGLGRVGLGPKFSWLKWVGFSCQNLFIFRYYNNQTDISLFISDCSHLVSLAVVRI